MEKKLFPKILERSTQKCFQTCLGNIFGSHKCETHLLQTGLHYKDLQNFQHTFQGYNPRNELG